MNLDIYDDLIRVRSVSMLSGRLEEVAPVERLILVPTDSEIVKAFLADDEIQEISISSTNIGFTKTVRKFFRGQAPEAHCATKMELERE